MKRTLQVVMLIAILVSALSTLAITPPPPAPSQIRQRFSAAGKLIEQYDPNTKKTTRYLADTGATTAQAPANRHMTMSTAGLAQYEYGQVSTWTGPGTYHGGPAVHINLDKSGRFCFTGLSTGPLYCGNPDGSQATGWPNTSDFYGAAYPVSANLDDNPATNEVFGAYWGAGNDPGMLIGYSGLGQILSGWPRVASNYIGTPFSATNVGDDYRDELFGEEEDWALHGYNADGSILPGWPVYGFGGQERHTPLIANINADSLIDIITGSGRSSPGVSLLGYSSNGQPLANYPVQFPSGGVDTFPVGWYGGQGFELVVGTKDNSYYDNDYPWASIVNVVDARTGVVLHTAQAPGTPYSSNPILADLNDDSQPEILLQTENCLNVWSSDLVPLWNKCWGTDRWISNSYTVVGDLDGDSWPEIVVISPHYSIYQPGWLLIFDREGNQRYKVDLPYLGSGGAPAIGDIDSDGRNELLVRYDYWDGHSGYRPTVGMFRFPQVANHTCSPEWPQFMSNPKHQGIWSYLASSSCVHYPPPPPPSFKIYLPLVKR